MKPVLEKFWAINCPSCASRIWFWRVHETFSCPYCAIEIKSNWGMATVKCCVAVLITLPILMPLAAWLTTIIFGKESGYLDWRLVLAFMEFAVVSLVYPRVLRLEILEEQIGVGVK